MIDPIQKIDDATSLSRRTQSAVGLSFPFVLPLKTKVVVKMGESKEADADLQQKLSSGAVHDIAIQCPLSLGLDDQHLWSLPVDPIISISGKNTIIRRSVSKHSRDLNKNYTGTIKERWNQEDYYITIEGVIIGDTYQDMCDYVKTLRTKLEDGKKGLDVASDFLNNTMNITRIAVEDYEFPFTPGMENQKFTIKAYSDGIYSLLIPFKR